MKLFYLKNNKSILINNENRPIENIIKTIDLRKESHKFLKSIETFHKDNFTIEDIFYCDKLPMYIFIRPNIAFWIKNIISAINIVNSIKEVGEIEEVVTDDYYVNLVCTRIFNIKSALEKVESVNNASSYKIQQIKRCIKGFKNYIKFKVRSRRKRNLIMFTQAASISKISHKEEYYDSKYGSLQEKLKKEFNILNLEYLHNKSFIEKSLKYNSNFVPFEFAIIMKKVLKEKLLKGRNVEDNFHKLSLFKYEVLNHDITELFIEFMNLTGKNACMSFLKEELYLENLMKKLRIEKCVVVDEGDRGRCFMAAGNKLGIDTYALQHGVISQGSYSYDVSLKNGELVVPKTTFLWGEKFKDILLENTNVYSTDNLCVIGQPRTDYLRIDKDNGKSLDKIKILFISQYMDDLVYPAGNIMFEAIANMHSDFELIIKLHPSDDKYGEYYNKEIDRLNLKERCKIAGDEDLYELLSWSDVVISVHSTVIMEATIINKPSICIRLDKYDDVCNFIGDRISLGAKNSVELRNILENYNNSFNEEYFKGVEAYVWYNFYKIDGNVCKRMMCKIIKD